MEKKPFKMTMPTLEELKQVLAFSRQHRNVIIKELHKRMPNAWARPTELDEQRFYENLLSSITDKENRKELEDAIETLKQQKSGRWFRVLDWRSRIWVNAMRELEQRNLEKYEKILAQGDERTNKELLDEVGATLNQLGSPAYLKVYRWLEPPVVDVQESDVKKLSDSIENKQSVQPTQEKLDSEWEIYIEQIREALKQALNERFSGGPLDSIGSALERLHKLAEAHESLIDQNQTRYLARLEDSLEGLRLCLDEKDQPLIALVDEVSAELSGGKLEFQEESEHEAVDVIEEQSKIFQHVNKRQHELKKQAAAALAEDNNDAALLFIRKRKDQELVLSGAKSEILTRLQTLKTQQKPAEQKPVISPQEDTSVDAFGQEHVNTKPNDSVSNHHKQEVKSEETLDNSPDEALHITITPTDEPTEKTPITPASPCTDSSASVDVNKHAVDPTLPLTPEASKVSSDNHSETGKQEYSNRASSAIVGAKLNETKDSSASLLAKRRKEEARSPSLENTCGGESPDAESNGQTVQLKREDLFNYESFCHNRWIAPDGTCQLAPWLDSSFVDRLQEIARKAVNQKNLAQLVILCRAQEELNLSALIASVDVRALAQLWMDPSSSVSAAGDDKRHTRILHALEQRYPREHIFVPTLLELVRPSGNFSPSPTEGRNIINALECSAPDLHSILETLLTFQQHGDDGWKRLVAQFHGENTLSADEILERLTAQRAEFKDRITKLWSAAAGKIQRTHCRKAWSNFVERYAAPLKEELIPSTTRKDFIHWDLAKLHRQIKKLPVQHAKLADSSSACVFWPFRSLILVLSDHLTIPARRTS